MARPPRPDKRPKIGLADTRDNQQRVNKSLDPGYTARVRKRGNLAGDGFFNILDEKERRLSTLRNKRFLNSRNKYVSVDEGLLGMLLSHVKHARVAPVRTPEGEPLIQHGKIIHEMVEVGCRVEMTQQQIATTYGRSRSYIADQLSLFRHLLLIVNWGDGWWEFDAHLVWRGDLEFQQAYRDVQPLQPLEIIGVCKHEALTDADLAALEAGKVE